ncbi:hypothetical protein ACJX0J_023765, partial [Zea mays]
NSTLMQMVGADWIKSDKREDDLAGQPGGLVQKRSLCLKDFVIGDDAFRNSRFKLIPYISKGSWVVKQSVGKKACLVGQALLEIYYFRGRNYLEV